MTTAESVQKKSPWSDLKSWKLQRHTKNIQMLKVLFYFGRHDPFFRVLVALVRACDHNNDHLNISGLSLVISVLAKMSCQVKKLETWKGKERITAIPLKWIESLCVGVSARFAKDLRRTWHLCSNLWSLQGLLHYSQSLSALGSPYKGCPWYPAPWQEQWCMERRESHTVWGCSEVLWNLIGNKNRFDRIHIHRLFDSVILQLLRVVLQQHWGAQVKPCCLCIA